MCELKRQQLVFLAFFFACLRRRSQFRNARVASPETRFRSGIRDRKFDGAAAAAAMFNTTYIDIQIYICSRELSRSNERLGQRMWPEVRPRSEPVEVRSEMSERN